jgi:aryl-alcohol dehydrogenase-like predicted oxidoreductase
VRVRCSASVRTFPRATSSGTRAYAQRFAGEAATGHFRNAVGLTVSSIGLGTYLGSEDTSTDRGYQAAVTAAVEGGINVIDSAVSYRMQRSERAVGRALADLAAIGHARQQLVIATKGGYLPSRDGRRYFSEQIVARGLATADDLVGGCHCLAPEYLRHQIRTSLDNLAVDAVDIYYLHNPEQQLDEVSPGVLSRRLRAAFELLEGMVAEGRIGVYGTATWNGFRVAPSRRGALSLESLVHLAREVAGDRHHFKVIQLPFNLAMTEARLANTQRVSNSRLCALDGARALGLTVMTSAPLSQGRLSGGLPRDLSDVLTGLDSDAQRAIQFARSADGVTTTLVGMRRIAHVRENLALVQRPPASKEAIAALLDARP